MAFLNDLYLGSSYTGNMYKVENDVLASSVAGGSTSDGMSCAVHTCQDRITVFIANKADNTISKFVRGVFITDIPVGNTPVAMCEDSYGALYVACYGDNMVYKLETDIAETTKVTAKINVEQGPMAICSDLNNTIWVACSDANSVCRIVGTTFIEPSIDMGSSVSQPQGIACDNLNNIWVSNYGANFISKINRNRKILDKDLGTGKAPRHIISDKNNNIYTVCEGSDTIIKYTPTIDTITEITLPSGSGATAIDFNEDGDIYVVCTLSGNVLKLHEDVVISTIPIAINVVGFGDFTGMLHYALFSTITKESLTTDEAAVELMKNISFDIKALYVKENIADTDIKFTCENVNLDSFDHIKVQVLDNSAVTSTVTAVRMAINEYQITAPVIASDIVSLTVVGYYDTNEKLPVQFNAMDFSQVFNIIAGTLADDGTGTGAYNFVPAKDSLKVVNASDKTTAFIIDPDADGNMVILISDRVSNTVARGITVNGMPISPNWEITAGSTVETNAKAAVYVNYKNYKIFMDPNTSFKDTPALMVRYQI